MYFFQPYCCFLLRLLSRLESKQNNALAHDDTQRPIYALKLFFVFSVCSLNVSRPPALATSSAGVTSFDLSLPIYQCASLHESRGKNLCRKQPLRMLEHTQGRHAFSTFYVIRKYVSTLEDRLNGGSTGNFQQNILTCYARTT